MSMKMTTYMFGRNLESCPRLMAVAVPEDGARQEFDSDAPTRVDPLAPPADNAALDDLLEATWPGGKDPWGQEPTAPGTVVS